MYVKSLLENPIQYYLNRRIILNNVIINIDVPMTLYYNY